ncbi:MAG: hypothetical protein ACJATP_002532 [Candidatus Azotimanducaceae bacterium]|jgi:hypothetical protein
MIIAIFCSKRFVIAKRAERAREGERRRREDQRCDTFGESGDSKKNPTHMLGDMWVGLYFFNDL